MEELSKSCDRADGKLSRGIARYLVGYFDLPQSYRIRAHMALTSVLCAQDTLRDAEEDYAEVQVKVSAGRHAQIQTELHAELQGIREAYKEKAPDERTVDIGDEDGDETTTSTFTESPQRGPGSQEDPIDLTFEGDSSPEDNTSDQSPVDSGYAEATDFMSARFSLSQRSMVTTSTHSGVKALLIVVAGLLFVHPPTMPLVSAVTTPSIMAWTSYNEYQHEEHNRSLTSQRKLFGTAPTKPPCQRRLDR